MTGAILASLLAFAAPKQQIFLLSDTQAALPAKHTKHFQLWGAKAQEEGKWVLQGIDEAQLRAPKEDAWWVGPKELPLESPVGFTLSLYGRPLFRPERTTSFCSGATYAALILGMQKQRPEDPGITPDAEESLRQTEADGSRRNDQIGFWGVWNGYGAGLYWALTDLTGAGRRIKPEEMRPGDFVQIYWSPKTGHSTSFLGWHQNKEGERFMRVWSSQEGTRGMGDWNVPVKRLFGLVCVRLTDSIRVLSAPVGTFPRTGPEGDKPPTEGWPPRR